MRFFSCPAAWFVLTAATGLGCSRVSASTPPGDVPDAGGVASGFGVVELFTSEGCSSCPPADDVLRELAADASRTSQHVYPLAFHVDYWNDLGWPDPYSAPLYTARQHAYGRALGQNGVYTPEMIINGRDAFVGSDRTRARHSIASALSQASSIRIDLHATVVDQRAVVDFTIAGAEPPDAVLALALVQSEARTEVRAGENAGRTLRHANVVRAFQTVTLAGSPSGRMVLGLPPSQRASDLAILAFLQDKKTMAITSATRANL